ncbi:MAG: TraR/DksA C4-type zinc finger protein [Pseudomonadota bacterium]
MFASRATLVASGSRRRPSPSLIMQALNDGQRALLKSVLEQRRGELAAQHDDTVPAGARDLAVQEVETSPADKATVRLLNDLALEAADLHANQMRSIRRALARIDDGSYGLCEECGKDIGFSRLQARPEAALCIACQTRIEKR